MKSNWRQFLVERGAEFEDGEVAHFGNLDLEYRVVTTGNVLADLSGRGLIGVHGADAVAFLQGQLTNDVRQVTAQRSQLSAWCSPKGRILVNFRILQRADTLLMELPRELVESTLKRLRMFVLMSKVVVEDASDGPVRIGCSGPSIEGELRGALGAVPAAVDDVLQAGELTVLRLPGRYPRFEVVGEVESAKKLWTTLNAQAAAVGSGPWRLLDIHAGVPVITPQTADAFVPQMVNLQALGGISFRKGCYTGQEVVARMQYLGKLKRRMYLAHVDSDVRPSPGDELWASHSEGGQGAGKLVNVEVSPEGGYDLLAVIQIASAQAGEVRLGGPQGALLQLQSLPYPLETARSV